DGTHIVRRVCERISVEGTLSSVAPASVRISSPLSALPDCPWELHDQGRDRVGAVWRATLRAAHHDDPANPGRRVAPLGSLATDPYDSGQHRQWNGEP